MLKGESGMARGDETEVAAMAAKVAGLRNRALARLVKAEANATLAALKTLLDTKKTAD